MSCRCVALVLAVAALASGCGGDLGSLPEPQAPMPDKPDEKASLAPVDLVLAADRGGVATIRELRDSKAQVDWEKDGAVALVVAARRGRVDVAELLLSYGACADATPRCYEALDEARARNEAAFVTFLESALPPESRRRTRR